MLNFILVYLVIGVVFNLISATRIDSYKNISLILLMLTVLVWPYLLFQHILGFIDGVREGTRGHYSNKEDEP